MVIKVLTANTITLIIVNKFLWFFIKYIIPITKKTICASKNGMVNISLKTPTITKSTL